MLRVSEAAERLGVNRRTVLDWINRGLVPEARYEKGRWLVPEDLERPQDGRRTVKNTRLRGKVEALVRETPGLRLEAGPPIRVGGFETWDWKEARAFVLGWRAAR